MRVYEYEKENIVFYSIFVSSSFYAWKNKNYTARNNTILETIALFSYSVDNKKIQVYNYDRKNRIMDFVINDNNIYFIELEEVNSDEYIWRFIKSDLKLLTYEIIKSGVIENPFLYPRIFMNNSYLILVTINDNGDE